MATALTLMAMAKEALEQELVKAGTRDGLCEMLLLHGDMVVIDYADCGGMGYVRLASANPSAAFPNPAPAGSCAHQQAFSMEMGIVRAAPGMEEGVRSPALPDAEDHLAATSLALEDMDVMRAALKVLEGQVFDFQLGTYTPVGPAGGALGGNWSFTVGEELDD